MTTEINQQGKTGLSGAASAAIAGAAARLSEAIGSPVRLEVTGIDEQPPPPGVEDIFIDAPLRGAAGGHSRFVMDGADAAAVVAAVVPGTTEDAPLDEAALASLGEAMASFVDGAAGALGDGLGGPIETSPPTVSTDPGQAQDGTITITCVGVIAGNADATLFWQIDTGLAAALGSWDAATAPASAAAAAPAAPSPVDRAPNATSPAPKARGGGVIDSVELDIAVELGNVAMAIGELLHMGEGSVVTLTQSVGDQVVMLANGTPVASGEVVVVDGTLGFRVAELITETPGA